MCADKMTKKQRKNIFDVLPCVVIKLPQKKFQCCCKDLWYDKDMCKIGTKTIF